MRLRLATSPPWVIGLVQGSFFGLAMAIFSIAAMDVPWFLALIAGVVVGVAFGALMGPVISRNTIVMLGDAATLPLDRLQIVVRGSWRGPVPEDADLRSAALDLARRRLDQTSRAHPVSIVVIAVLSVLSLGMALTWSLWWLIAMPFWSVVLITTVRAPGRLRERIVLLERGTDGGRSE